ncbi:MAG: hypothetical protein JSW12_13505 [Deltaproteobacteria bacterium]|nr:MAG: hypothetical protein JSW12_13505 [Deltaproteobacteria bacterium]
MKEIFLTKAFLLCSTVMLAGGLAFLTTQSSYADYLGVLQAALPDHIRGWSAEPEDRLFDNETIFDYIDGTGEVYRAYNMVKCLSRRYTNPQGAPIILDIFEMGSSEDAFGVFTHDQDGEPLDLGQGALYRASWLSFWKDRFFVSIYAEEETASAATTVRELGKAVASVITAEGPKPQILLHLPSLGLQPRSVRYLHHHIVLNYHFYLSDENILNLGQQTEAALARYQRAEEYAQLLVVRYPSEGEAKKAFANILKYYLPDGDSSGLVRLENGRWSAADLRDKLLTIVLEADSRQLAKSLLQGVAESTYRN